MQKEKFLKTKKVTATLAVISFVGGAYFLKSNITGNVILESGTSFNSLGVIGLSLIACSLILGLYSTRKK